MQKETYNKLLNERMTKTQKISREIDYNKLIYYFKTPGISPINFIRFRDSQHIYNEINNDYKTIQAAEEEQIKFKSDLGEITSENPKHKSKDQLDAIKNINNLYDSRQKIFNLFNDNAKIRSEAIHKTKQDGTGLKILTPKQMLQRLLIALAQVKTGHNSEILLNEIRKIVCSMYQSKGITKKSI